MSKARRLRKANLRQAAHRAKHGPICPRCGARESHYCPPSLGDPGFYICAVLSQPHPAQEQQT